MKIQPEMLIVFLFYSFKHIFKIFLYKQYIIINFIQYFFFILNLHTLLSYFNINIKYILKNIRYIIR